MVTSWLMATSDQILRKFAYESRTKSASREENRRMAYFLMEIVSKMHSIGSEILQVGL